MNLLDLVYSIHFIFLTLVVLKVSKWFLIYIQNLYVINKIPGLPILPFIGNGHNLKKKNGIKLIRLNLLNND